MDPFDPSPIFAKYVESKSYPHEAGSIYARVSAEMQAEEEESVAAPVARLHEWAKADGS